MFAYDTDRQETINDNAALELCLDGFEDGFTGKLAQSSQFEYLKGYLEGVARGIKEDQERATRFEEFRQREEALHRGEPDWLDEVMATNDEPLLGDEEMEDPDLIVGSEEITYCFPNGKSYVHYFDADTEF